MPTKPRFGSIYRPKKTLPDGSRVETKVWWISYYSSGVKQRESSKSRGYREAEQLLRQRLAEIENGTFGGVGATRILVGELLDDLIDDFEINEKSVAWCRMVCNTHLRPVFGTMRASRIQTKHLNGYVKARKGKGIANSTIQRELMRLKRAFNLGREATPPKVAQLPRFPKLKEPPPRKGFFEFEDFTSMRSELPEHLRPVITFAYQTGCRVGEILSLQWSQLDLAHRVIRLHPGETKNDEARVIPIGKELFEMLLIQKSARDARWPDCLFVFFRYGKQILDFRGAWDGAAKRAELWDPTARKGKGGPARLFHDLRRTGARNLVRAGVPERVVMAIGGWKTRAVFDRYNIVSERDLHDAAAKLDEHLRENARRAATGKL